ncbi:MAG: hypothetical protein D6788_00470 [Planctomycetota bacterium]|nr:MAG: hypothetical protein D6788_00470 [Planctomycetota bacterium]
MGCLAALWGATVMASGLNLRVTSNGSSTVDVSAGDTVNYEIRGVLTDTNNQGLALFGFDLSFDGGPLTQVAPTAAVMSFVIPDGITNPAGFGGTTDVPGREGELVQVGGAQNTINNVETNAPFPIGTVVLNIGHTEEVLATGTLTAPTTPGTYTLTISNGFANVISATQPPGISFMVVEEATPVTGENLTINVGAACTIAGGTLPNCAIDARQDSDPDGSNPGGMDQLTLTLSCAGSSVTAGDFTVTSVGGTAPTIADVVSPGGNDVTISFTGPIPVGAWTCIELGGTSRCVGWLPGDVNNDGIANADDVIAAIDCATGVATCALYQCDADRSGLCGPSDTLRTIDLLNGGGVYTSWMGMSLAACPAP